MARRRKAPEEKGKKRRDFRSVSELADFVEARTTGEHYSNHYSDVWSGLTSWDNALELARHGWPEGVQALQLATDQLKRQLDYSKVEYRWDVTGDVFDVGKVLSGEPECWLYPEPTESNRVITICVHLSSSSSVTSETINRRGAAIVALIDHLQSAPGTIVELTLLYHYLGNASAEMSYGGHTAITCGTSPLDIDMLAFAIGHPAMLRRLLFALTEVDNGKQELTSAGYGSPQDLTHDQQQAYSLYLGATRDNDGPWRTTELAARWVEAVINNLNRA